MVDLDQQEDKNRIATYTRNAKITKQPENAYLLEFKHDLYGFNVCQLLRIQNGPVKEVGLNGWQIEDLLRVIIDKLKDFQNSDFHCKENSQALFSLEEALKFLELRHFDRVNRGVEGRNLK